VRTKYLPVPEPELFLVIGMSVASAGYSVVINCCCPCKFDGRSFRFWITAINSHGEVELSEVGRSVVFGDGGERLESGFGRDRDIQAQA